MQTYLGAWLCANKRITPSWTQFETLKLPFDHLALRTFAHYGVGQDRGLEALTDSLCRWGYEIKGHYNLPSKKVRAHHLELAGYPKIFLSELLWREFSDPVQEVLERILSKAIGVSLLPGLFSGVRPWTATKEDYDLVATETSYGAWLLAWGYIPNHFAVHLDMERAKELCSQFNVPMNDDGRIQGSKKVGLEQCSTKADKVEHPEFGEIEGGFVEFVQRWQDPVDRFKIYPGFVEASASKIMESTDVLPRSRRS